MTTKWFQYLENKTNELKYNSLIGLPQT